jgi:hypothetical protein
MFALFFVYTGMSYKMLAEDYKSKEMQIKRLTSQLDTCNHRVDTYQMCGNKVLESEFGVKGVYISQKGYYCVWTEGRLEEFYNRTDYHEMCHAFIIDYDGEHFCGDYCDQR